MTQVRLSTPRLELRPCDLDDLPALHGLWTRREVRRFLFDDRALSRDEVLRFVEASLGNFADHGYGLWVLRETDQDEIAGFAGLLRSDEAPKLIYGTAPERNGRGYATEAARAVLRYAFETLRFSCVLADVDEPNAASVRVLEKLGMARVRRALVNDRPLLYFELTAGRWRERKAESAA